MTRLPSSRSFSSANASSSKDHASARSSRVAPVIWVRYSLAIHRGERARLYRTQITGRSEEHTSELQSLRHLVCRLLLEKKKNTILNKPDTTLLLPTSLDRL